MELILPQWGQALPKTGALASTRACGNSAAPYDDGCGAPGLNLALHVGDAIGNVQRNRAQIRRHLPAEPVWLNQVHGCDVVDAAMVSDMALQVAPQADASFTTRPGVVCAVLTADCLPVLLTDTCGRVVAAAHAGWRGLAAGVLENTVAQMRAAGGQELLAWLGPAIGPAQFEVGEDVLDAFVTHNPAAAHAFQAIAARPGKYLADIYSLARDILLRAGVVRVSGGNYCTVSTPQRFYSFRRDGVTGRMASMIWLRT
jgi:YfiH family protein